VDSMPAALLFPLARVGAAAVGVTGPSGMRERLLLAAAGKLGEAEAVWLGQELDALAGLLSRGGSQPANLRAVSSNPSTSRHAPSAIATAAGASSSAATMCITQRRESASGTVTVTSTGLDPEGGSSGNSVSVPPLTGNSSNVPERVSGR
jgi:hypothetical protein